MPSNDVYTAVSLDETNMKEPFLIHEEDENEEPKTTTLVDVGELNPSFRWHGLVIGFLAQLINVSGTTYMYYKYEGGKISNNDKDDDNNNNIEDTILHGLVWLITQVDLYLYIFMWVSLTAVLTKSGMDYVRNTYFEPTQKPTKRSIFVLGVQFYVGVVLGVFCAWTGIDVLLGLPVPVLPMVGVLLFGLFISYTMVWCYDMEDVDEDEDEDYHEEEENKLLVV